MALNKTKIEWADATWNPVTGCYHGCDYCYARGIARRFGSRTQAEPAQGAKNLHVLEAPVINDATGMFNPYPFGFEATFHRYRLHDLTTKPGQTVFVCSMADLFGEWVPDEWIEQVFQACIAAPQHTYLFLTKNPKRLCDLANAGKLPQKDNFWWGSTLDNKNARRFGGRLLDHTFLSIEPLTEYMDVGLGSFGRAEWIIIGAETGNRKGKVTPERSWIRNIEEAAAITHAAVFMKDSLIPIVGEAHMRREFPWND